MSTQITVRLPDEMVAFLDDAVSAGEVPSRAALVAAAVEREMRWRAARRDAAILRAHDGEDDLDDLVAWSVTGAVLED